MVLEQLTKKLAVCGSLGLIVSIAITCTSILAKLIRRGIGEIEDLLNIDLTSADSPWLDLSWIRPILGEEELVELGIAVSLFSLMPWITLMTEHLRVNVLENFFTPMMNRILNVFSDLALVGLTYLILINQWYLVFEKTRGSEQGAFQHLLSGHWQQLADLIKTYDQSQILSIPLWPIYLYAEFCIALVLVCASYCLYRSLMQLNAADTSRHQEQPFPLAQPSSSPTKRVSQNTSSFLRKQESRC